MLENIDPGGMAEMNQLAAWLLGTAVVLLVIGIALGVIRWAGGGAIASAANTKAGLAMVCLSLAGAVVLGSIGGAVQWSSSDDRTIALMPEGAQPTEIHVTRDAPRSRCTEPAVINFEDNHDDQDSEDYIDWATRTDWVTSIIGEDHPLRYFVTQRVVADQPDDMFERGRIDRIEWFPDGVDGDCSNSNTNVAEGSEVEVIRECDSVLMSGDEAIARNFPDDSTFDPDNEEHLEMASDARAGGGGWGCSASGDWTVPID